MQKPTIAQQRILNAMNGGALLILFRADQQLSLLHPDDRAEVVSTNQAFHMERKGLIEVVMRSSNAIEYVRTQAYNSWARERSIAGHIKGKSK